MRNMFQRTVTKSVFGDQLDRTNVVGMSMSRTVPSRQTCLLPGLDGAAAHSAGPPHASLTYYVKPRCAVNVRRCAPTQGDFAGTVGTVGTVRQGGLVRLGGRWRAGRLVRPRGSSLFAG